MSRRTIITDVAITTLARQGMRGFTHRAVDRAADLPEGSTSYYFRTRSALLTATVDRLAELDAAQIPAPVPDLDTLATVLASSVQQWVGADRDRQLARYELTLESIRRPELREPLRRGGATVRDGVAVLLDRAAVPAPRDRARELVACLDGLIFDRIAGTGEAAPGVEETGATLRRIITAMTV